MGMQDEAIRRATKVDNIIDGVATMVRAVNDNEDPDWKGEYPDPPNEWVKLWAEKIVNYVIGENAKR